MSNRKLNGLYFCVFVVYFMFLMSAFSTILAGLFIAAGSTIGGLYTAFAVNNVVEHKIEKEKESINSQETK